MDVAICVRSRTGVTTGFNTLAVTKKETERNESEWMLEEQVGDALKNPALGKLLCQSGDLDSRPSKWPSLADKGIKEFHFTREMQVNAFEKMESVGTQIQAELTKEEYDQATASMKSSSKSRSVGVKRKAVAQKPKEISEDEKKLKAAQVIRAAAQRKSKALSDRLRQMILGDKALLPKIREKGYPEAMTEWLLKQMSDLETEQSELHDLYCKIMMKPSEDATTTTVQHDTDLLEAAGVKSEKAADAYKKGARVDILRMST